jgi:hypothetical protein
MASTSLLVPTASFPSADPRTSSRPELLARASPMLPTTRTRRLHSAAGLRTLAFSRPSWLS